MQAVQKFQWPESFTPEFENLTLDGYLEKTGDARIEFQISEACEN